MKIGGVPATKLHLISSPNPAMEHVGRTLNVQLKPLFEVGRGCPGLLKDKMKKKWGRRGEKAIEREEREIGGKKKHKNISLSTSLF